MFYHLLRCVDRLIKSFQPFYATAALVLVIFSSYIIVQSIVTEVWWSSLTSLSERDLASVF